jgi:hypothetical protein
MAKEPPAPYLPATYDVADIAAIQACCVGEATPQQQKRAMDWIMYKAANMNDLEYRTDGRDHAFASGRRYVGMQIYKLTTLNKGAFR